MNNLTISGTLASDIESVDLESAIPMCKGLIYSNVEMKNVHHKRYNQQIKHLALYFNAFDKEAEYMLKYLKKGDKIILVGELSAQYNKGRAFIYMTVRRIYPLYEKASNEELENYEEETTKGLDSTECD